MDLRGMADIGHVEAQVILGGLGFAPTWPLWSYRLCKKPAAATDMPGSGRRRCPHHPQSVSDY